MSGIKPSQNTSDSTQTGKKQMLKWVEKECTIDGNIYTTYEEVLVDIE